MVHQVWRYYIPSVNGEGWGVFFLDSDGIISAVTDYGNYGCWFSDPGCKDFREFFLNAWRDRGYFLRKFAVNTKKVYQGEETFSAIKQEILSRRRGNGLSKEAARSEWKLLHYDWLESLHLYEQALKWLDLTEMDFDDGPPFVFDHSRSLKKFVDELLPRLSLILTAELASEQEDKTNTLLTVAPTPPQ